jgi:hypothetical protein
MANGKKRGRPKLEVEKMYIPFRLRRGRSEAEDNLMDRLAQLTETGQRSRFIRHVLTTGDIEPVLDREFVRETERVASALDALATLWRDDDE